MKKNKMLRIASVLLVAILLTTCAISGTFAKYISTDSAYDTARVAKWDIQLNGKDIAAEEFTFDLFKTIIDTANDAAETDVAVKAGENIIAPGTKGEFEITLKNDSEVNAAYEINFGIENAANIPLKFTVNSNEGLNNISADLAMGATATYTIAWEWAFDGVDNTFDTNLGLDGTHTITVSASIIATQVN